MLKPQGILPTATFNAHQQHQQQPNFDTFEDSRWKITPSHTANKYNFPESYH